MWSTSLSGYQEYTFRQSAWEHQATGKWTEYLTSGKEYTKDPCKLSRMERSRKELDWTCTQWWGTEKREFNLHIMTIL